MNENNQLIRYNFFELAEQIQNSESIPECIYDSKNGIKLSGLNRIKKAELNQILESLCTFDRRAQKAFRENYETFLETASQTYQFELVFVTIETAEAITLEYWGVNVNIRCILKFKILSKFWDLVFFDEQIISATDSSSTA